MRPDEGMHAVLRGIRRAGFQTALLSNSWGRWSYPREQFGELFDAVVISGDTGMRKPEERIFRHAAGLLGLPPEQCVFIDDIEAQHRRGRGHRDDRHPPPGARRHRRPAVRVARPFRLTH